MLALRRLIAQRKEVVEILASIAAADAVVLFAWSPPWPPGTVRMVTASALVVLVVAMAALLFWNPAEVQDQEIREKPRNPKRRTRFAFLYGLIVLLPISIVYGWSYIDHTLYINELVGTVVIGNDFKNDDVEAYLHHQHHGDVRKLIFDRGVENTYEESGLKANRFWLLLWWGLMQASLAIVMFSYILADPQSSQFQRDDQSK